MALYLGSNKVDMTSGEVSGGGGSSDFTTAVMTVVPEEVSLTVPLVYDGENEHGIIAVQTPFAAGTYYLALYKGFCVFEMPVGYTVTGNAVDNEGNIIVSGDFSVVETQ